MNYNDYLRSQLRNFPTSEVERANHNESLEIRYNAVRLAYRQLIAEVKEIHDRTAS